MATNSNSLEGLQLRLSQMESKLRETSASSSTFDKLAQGVVKFKDEIEALQNRIKAFENVKGSINDLNFQIQIINNQINKQAPNSGLIPSLVMQSVELANRLKAIQDNIKMLSFAPNTLEALNFQLSLTNEKYNKTTDQTIFNQIAVEALATEKQIESLNNKIAKAKGRIQKLQLFKRGSAISGAPIISGTIQFPNPPIMAGITMKKIMISACMVVIWLKKSGFTNCRPGWKSSARITMAMAPPVKNMVRAKHRYRVPMSL